MGYSSERATMRYSAIVYDKMCAYMSLLFDRSESLYGPSEVNSIRLADKEFSRVTCNNPGLDNKFSWFWDISQGNLEIAFDYATQGHWSIEDILISHYLYYAPFSSISKDIDMLPKSVAHYCTIGTNRFMLSYAQITHQHYQRLRVDNDSIALLEAIDPVIASLTL